ncbi:39S ribosomal protein L9, mitochondrial [Leptidea sinapis]|uniref:39S ribosomal protein L9, mitochondrial n=1 Tax=Leptidea sinapis TaxID=189913 RepID=UPI002142AC8B|nr:39S ribosomal protein L9, mitochondrial [Leptidea sinapis]
MLSIRSLFCKTSFIEPNIIIAQQTRNTFILKRKWPPPLHKKGGKPDKMKSRHFVYELVEDTNVKKQQDMKVILSQFVDGVGNVGDVVSLRPNTAYRKFLLPGLAVYATPENLEKYKSDENKPKVEKSYSSPYVPRTIGCLSRLVLQISMSKTTPWKLEPWHIRTSFRKVGFVVPEETITMPPQEIQGPDLSLQEKEFYVTVKINNREDVNVRCRIYHWATTALEKLPWVAFHWKKPLEPLFPEQAEILEKLPLPE